MSVVDCDPLRLESAPEALDPSASVMDPATRKPDRSHDLAEICRKHHSALVRFLSLRTGSAEDAKEIVQEAYAKILALERPDTLSVQVGYLWRIAANLAIDRKRQRAARARLANVWLQPTRSAGPSTELVVELNERLTIVQKAIAQLPPKCRQAFLLRIVEGHRFSQVGREMGITERMAKLHVARAMEFLQARLDSADGSRKLR